MSSTTQSLAFRVMRLCRPTFHVETPLRFDLGDLVVGEDLLDDSPHLLQYLSTTTTTDLTYTNRFLHPHNPSDAMGMLLLPQSFGAIYLGETFCSYISINNSSSFEVRDIVIKAEIQTERQRILLLDTTKTPVETIRAGGRYDFIVEHDVKELGAHTLVCTAQYSDGDAERKYLPQYFKFMVSNPLSVRTKVRVVKETTYLEACLENNTKSNLYMDQVDFEPTSNWSATLLKPDAHHSAGFTSSEIPKVPILIKSGGGIHNYLYQLKSLSEDGSAPTKFEGGNVLGKLQITWRTNLGEPGRLQTQQITGNLITQREVELKATKVSSVIILEKPFTVCLSLTNLTVNTLGPFEVFLSASEEKALIGIGLKKMVLPQVEAFKSLDFQMTLFPTEAGMQKISGITVFNTAEKKSYDPLPDIEIFVDAY